MDGGVSICSPQQLRGVPDASALSPGQKSACRRGPAGVAQPVVGEVVGGSPAASMELDTGGLGGGHGLRISPTTDLR